MLLNDELRNYELLDCGDGQKLERWDELLLVRPDPVAIWLPHNEALWNEADAIYHRSNKGGGYWQKQHELKEDNRCYFRDLTFKVSPTDFKHTGIFPEQASNWAYLSELISGKEDIRVLNLFAYTGCASMVAAYYGASEVVHVDASKGIINWAKENMELNKLGDRKIRFIVDDCLKFMKRELRRGHQYEIILMDPPSYGRGPNNEVFHFEEQINELIATAMQLLSERALCLFVSSYSAGYSCGVMNQVLQCQKEKLKLKGKVYSEELGIKVKDSDYVLPCGLVSRFEYEGNL